MNDFWGFWGTLSRLAGLASLGLFLVFFYSLVTAGQLEGTSLGLSLGAAALSWLFSYLDDGTNPLTGKNKNQK